MFVTDEYLTRKKNFCEKTDIRVSLQFGSYFMLVERNRRAKIANCKKNTYIYN